MVNRHLIENEIIETKRAMESAIDRLVEAVISAEPVTDHVDHGEPIDEKEIVRPYAEETADLRRRLSESEKLSVAERRRVANELQAHWEKVVEEQTRRIDALTLALNRSEQEREMLSDSLATFTVVFEEANVKTISDREEMASDRETIEKYHEALTFYARPSNQDRVAKDRGETARRAIGFSENELEDVYVAPSIPEGGYPGL